MSSTAPRAKLGGHMKRVRLDKQKPTSVTEGLLTPFRNVRWTVSYAALLLYIVVITTYTISFGSVVIGVAIAGLAFERRARFSALGGWLALLFSWAFLSQFTSPWPGEVREELIAFGKVIIIAVVAGATLTDRARLRLFMIVSVATFAMYPARGALFNYFLGGYSLMGRAIWNNIFANPNDMAAFTLLQLSVAVALFLSEPRGIYRLGAAASLVVMPFLILLTQSRGVFLGLLVFALLGFTAHRRKARLLGLAAIVGVVAVLLLPAAAWDRIGMVRVIGSGGTEVLGTLEDLGSAQQRYEIWQNSFRIISDRPVQGVGWGVYALANEQYSPGLGVRDTHSTYFNIAAVVGIPGLLVFLGLVGATLARARSAHRRLVAVNPLAGQQIKFLTVGLVGFLVAAAFATYSGITLFYIHIALIWAFADTHLRTVDAGPPLPGGMRASGRARARRGRV